MTILKYYIFILILPIIILDNIMNRIRPLDNLSVIMQLLEDVSLVNMTLTTKHRNLKKELLNTSIGLIKLSEKIQHLEKTITSIFDTYPQILDTLSHRIDNVLNIVKYNVESILSLCEIILSSDNEVTLLLKIQELRLENDAIIYSLDLLSSELFNPLGVDSVKIHDIFKEIDNLHDVRKGANYEFTHIR